MQGNNFSLFSVIASSDMIGKTILLVLFSTSIMSWAIIIQRFILYKNIYTQVKNFDKNFWSSRSLDNIYNQAKLFDSNILSLIFVQVMDEWKKIGTISNAHIATSVKERILNSMNYIKSLEIAKLENNLYTLALIGSKAPFVGLLGTVWGIMNSFKAIAVMKNTNLNVVAPGVAEALMVTAIGLWVAIPSLIFYNFLSAKINKLDNEIDYFTGRIYNLFSQLIDDRFVACDMKNTTNKQIKND